MGGRKDDRCLSAKSTEAFSKPLITLIGPDDGVELVREKGRSRKMPDLASQVCRELRDWPFEEVHGNAGLHGLGNERFRFNFGVEEMLQLKRLLLWGIVRIISVYQ